MVEYRTIEACIDFARTYDQDGSVDIETKRLKGKLLNEAKNRGIDLG